MAVSKIFFGAAAVAIALGLHGCGGSGDEPVYTTLPTTPTTTTTTSGWQPCNKPGACCTGSLGQMCPGNVECGDCGATVCQCPTPPTTPAPQPGWEPCNATLGLACCDPIDPESRCPDDTSCNYCGDVACQCCDNRLSNGTCPMGWDTTTSTTTTTTPPPPTTTTSSHPGPDGKCANENEQCGGIGYNITGPTCCVGKLACLRDNDYYWACGDPDAPTTTPGPTTTTDPDAPTTTAGCGAEYAQCGGDKTYHGPTCCLEGFVCRRQDENYAACVDPKSTTPASTASTASTASSPTTPASASSTTLSPTTAATSSTQTPSPTSSTSSADAFHI